MNRINVFMFALSLLLAACGLAIIWAGFALHYWEGAVIGLAWVAFAGPGAIYSWRTRYER